MFGRQKIAPRWVQLAKKMLQKPLTTDAKCSSHHLSSKLTPLRSAS